MADQAQAFDSVAASNLKSDHIMFNAQSKNVCVLHETIVECIFTMFRGSTSFDVLRRSEPFSPLIGHSLGYSKV